MTPARPSVERAALMPGGSSRLYRLVLRGAATRVTRPMYLVPPCTPLLAAQPFGERLRPLVLAGMALMVPGVGPVVREPGRKETKT